MSMAGRDDDPQKDFAPVEVFSSKIASLQAIAAAYKLDNARLLARVAELEIGSPDDDALRPLKALVDDAAMYEAARRARRSGLLHAVRRGGRWFATAKAIREWRAGR